MVSRTADGTQTGTLRWAIDQANAATSADKIAFSTLLNSPQTITREVILLFTAPGLAKTQSGLISVSPAAASSLSITARTAATVGVPFTITVTAFDPYGNVASSSKEFLRILGPRAAPSSDDFVAGVRKRVH